MNRTLKTVLAVVAGLVLVASTGSAATVNQTMNIDTILADNPAGLSGSVVMTINSQHLDRLVIVIANTSDPGSASGAGGLLSGMAFAMPSSYTILSGSATVTSGSQVVGSSIGYTGSNVSGEWGYATSQSGHFNALNSGAVNLQVAAMQADTDVKFSKTPVEKPAVLDGPEYGLVRNGGSPGGLAAIENSVTITLNFSGDLTTFANAADFLAGINDGQVAIEFGSPGGGGTTVPDGGSTLALLGLGIMALGAFARWLKA